MYGSIKALQLLLTTPSCTITISFIKNLLKQNTVGYTVQPLSEDCVRDRSVNQEDLQAP